MRPSQKGTWSIHKARAPFLGHDRSFFVLTRQSSEVICEVVP